MKHAAPVWAGVLSLLALAACGEKPQSAGGGQSEAAPYAGTGSGFMEPGWKPGDKTSWEQHLRARQQRGQNDYSRMP